MKIEELVDKLLEIKYQRGGWNMPVVVNGLTIDRLTIKDGEIHLDLEEGEERDKQILDLTLKIESLAVDIKGSYPYLTEEFHMKNTAPKIASQEELLILPKQENAGVESGGILKFPLQRFAKVECVDNLQFMRQFDDSSMHLIVTSPPYNLGKAYEARISQDVYLEQQVATIAEAVRLLHPKGSICWQVGHHVDNGEIYPLDVLLYPLFKTHGLQLRNRIVWTFGHGLHCQRRFSGRHETILWFTKSEDYTFHLDPVRVPSKYPFKKSFKGPNKGMVSSNPLGKNPADVWDIPNVKANHVEKTEHPCQFPVGLAERLILALTNPGDNILDPYMGVGSTMIGAMKNDRNAYGCDIMPEYVEIALDRLKALRAGTLRTRPMNKPVVYQPGSETDEPYSSSFACK